MIRGSLFFIALVFAVIQPFAAVNPFLQTLVETPGGVVIAYGSDPSSLTAANIIRDAIRLIPGQSSWNNLRTAASFDADTFTVTGQVHVIAVGAMRDNIVIQNRTWPSAWWLDRDWYYSNYPNAVSPLDAGLPYQPTTGFIFGGFGEWPSSESRIGFIEIDRSFYFMEWVGRTRWNYIFATQSDPSWSGLLNWDNITFPRYPTGYALRLMTHITGTGDSGVVAAARAFAQNNMLSGVVPANGASADNGPTMFTLAQSHYAQSLPFSAPDNIDGYTYLGWLLPDAFDYDGFTDIASVTPQRMFRVKYKSTGIGITNFWQSPHRRAEEFEICAMKFSSASDAAMAKSKIDAAEASLPGAVNGTIKSGYFGTASTGPYLYVQALVNGNDVLSAFAALPPW